MTSKEMMIICPNGNLKSYILNLQHERDKYKEALDRIEKFMIYEFSGQNQWVKKNVLNVINKVKENK